MVGILFIIKMVHLKMYNANISLKQLNAEWYVLCITDVLRRHHKL